ncbi:MAG: hypothetical protein HY608_07485 [Planctomycetes bacterium]|nr:hypothetical protein [Planctomycetota bacterium]
MRRWILRFDRVLLGMRLPSWVPAVRLRTLVAFEAGAFCLFAFFYVYAAIIPRWTALQEGRRLPFTPQGLRQEVERLQEILSVNGALLKRIEGSLPDRFLSYETLLKGRTYDLAATPGVVKRGGQPVGKFQQRLAEISFEGPFPAVVGYLRRLEEAGPLAPTMTPPVCFRSLSIEAGPHGLRCALQVEAYTFP